MSSTNSGGKKQETAFTVFSAVDKSVSKPVFGSDGAASWQSFRESSQHNLHKKPSTAPTAPLKHSDRASGITSWDQERSTEKLARQESGAAPMNAGYTTFAEKPAAPDTRKKDLQRIQERRIGANQQYFIKSDTFSGWKWDYVFTTRKPRGTGYYFDGTDSVKELNGDLKRGPEESNSTAEAHTSDTQPASKKQKVVTEKKTKKKKKPAAAPVIVSDPTNPREQVMAALQARTRPAQLPPEWESATDPISRKTYYFHRTSGERTWEMPSSNKWKQVTTKDRNTGKDTVYYFNEATRETRWDKPDNFVG